MSENTLPLAFMLLAALFLTGLGAMIAHDAEIDARAPIVETCVQHPATRSPFR